jgi:DNA invertase Pin-like site-specific DNA recombinase
VIYTRVSREEQVEGWSLDAQRDQCLMFAEARGWEVSRVFEEQGRSAKTDLGAANGSDGQFGVSQRAGLGAS